MTKYCYEAFGMVILSDFEFDGLVESNGVPDLTILRGTVPIAVNNITHQEFRLLLNGIGKFFISNGRKIIVEPFDGVSSSYIRSVILGIAISVAILQRGRLPFHGSAVLVDKKCIVIAGNSGAGKSTLAYAFRQQGAYLLSDDISVLYINEDGNSIMVEPSFPQQKLWQDTADQLGVMTDDLARVLEDKEKFLIPVVDNFHNTAHAIDALYVLSKDNISSVTIEKLSGAQKFVLITDNIYHVSILKNANIDQSYYFKVCSKIAKSIPIYRITRPVNGFTADSQMEMLLETLQYI